MRISDWSSDVCSSDLVAAEFLAVLAVIDAEGGADGAGRKLEQLAGDEGLAGILANRQFLMQIGADPGGHVGGDRTLAEQVDRSEEHTSELQSLMRNSYAVFCLKKKRNKRQN